MTGIGHDARGSGGSGFLEPGPGGSIMPEPPTPEIARLARIIPRNVRLGTCSWAFPGWRGLVWSRFSGTRNLARDGLRAYSASPLLRAAEIDRSYYKPLTLGNYWHFAGQVPKDFRFIVKAPSLVTDSLLRGKDGRPTGPNPHFLDLAGAVDEFVAPVLEGLSEKAGPLVFEFSRAGGRDIDTLEKRIGLIERLGEFLSRLPAIPETSPDAFYAVEIRTRQLYTPRYLSMLRSAGARPVVGLHPLMPGVERQTLAIHSLDDPEGTAGGFRLGGPLLIRWNLALGDRFDDALKRFQPFDSLKRPDPVTREGVVALIEAASRGGQKAYFAVNNKAEGCAPLSVLEVARRLASRISERRDASMQP